MPEVFVLLANLLTFEHGKRKAGGMASESEQKILDKVAAGEWATFSQNEPHEVSADFLRRLLLGLEDVTIRAPGIRISGAVVTGEMLDLAGCSGGEGLPPLALEDCALPQLDFSGAVLAGLSIKGSTIRVVKLVGARINSGFDFSKVQAHAEGEEARIDGRSCTIDGEVRGDGAKLRVPEPQVRENVRTGQEIYALCLRDATIRGSVWLTYGFEASGGVRISAVRNRRRFLCRGCRDNRWRQRCLLRSSSAD